MLAYKGIRAHAYVGMGMWARRKRLWASVSGDRVWRQTGVSGNGVRCGTVNRAGVDLWASAWHTSLDHVKSCCSGTYHTLSTVRIDGPQYRLTMLTCMSAIIIRSPCLSGY